VAPLWPTSSDCEPSGPCSRDTSDCCQLATSLMTLAGARVRESAAGRRYELPDVFVRIQREP
jgi:hypothetical protein